MRKSMLLASGVLVLIIIVGIGIFAYTQSNKDKIQDKDDSMMEDKDDTDDKAMEDKDAMDKEDDSKPGSYIEYKKSSLTEKKNVIFFAASWCPTCRALDKAINSDLDSIPSDLTILKADYDKEKDLKKKYGVTYQHTLVQVDQNGNMLKKWSNSQDISEIISQLK